MMTENMQLIMAKVRAHIMTGKSASTPPFSTKPVPKTDSGKQVEQVSNNLPKPAAKKANTIKWPDDDIPY